MFHTIYEVPTKCIAHLLPKGVEPVEPRPGIALYDIGQLHWTAGNLAGAWPEFDELTIMVLVQPDLSIDMALPKFCFFVLRIAANYQPFVENEERVLRLPTAYMPASCTDLTEPIGVEVRDVDSVPLRLLDTHGAPIFRKDEFYGQYYTAYKNQLWFGIWKWEGTLFEHQRHGAGCDLSNHQLLYGDLDVEQHCKEIYLQLFTEPGKRCIETFYEPWVLRDL